MEFEHSEKVRTLQARVKAFMVEHIYPNEEELFAEVNEGDRWQPVPLLEELKAKALGAERRRDAATAPVSSTAAGNGPGCRDPTGPSRS